ncbi:hypothetical protein [Nocardia lijiangensis]|uniref:hypothetical protein n=1 Tax=Nocardia lijiangensis TaxID=299618 RepID=UPI00083061A2|nr:hypothetical protein [Nocardia lijiangensis]
MRTQPIKFAGYGAGQTDFDAVEGLASPGERLRLHQVLDRITQHVLNPAGSGFTSLTIVGHSDRQDLAAMTCDQRRTSESEAAENRASSAWAWVKTQVNGRLVLHGVPAVDEWWESNPAFTWALVYAGAGQLEYPQPSSEQRALNRRVLFLVGVFPA